jgi:2-polyprenyl-3-methyl-5-hydroxy-6-metoxy-1,4-benzoquinol methylase
MKYTAQKTISPLHTNLMLIRRKHQPHCPACDSFGTLLYDEIKDYYFNSPDTWSLKQCKQCKSIWLDPAPLAEDIGMAYANYHTHSGVRKNRVASTFRKLSQKFSHLQLIFHPDYQSMLEDQKNFRYLNLQNVTKGKMLDVGCGGGRFLNRMQRIGWDVEGIDFDAVATKEVASKYGFTVHTGDLRDVQLAENTYDVVVMSHAIEHVFDPESLLTEIRRILKIGGRLLLVTPNANSIAHRRFGAYWRGLEVPRHIQIFSLSGLETVVKKAGLILESSFSFAHGAEGIYYVSKEMKSNQQKTPFREASEAFKSKISTLAEYRRLRKDRDIGEDLFISAIKTKN